VLGPSEDGGYYLIGLRTPVARLFEEIAWSTAAVAAQTRERAAEAGLPVEMLRRWYDVDDADSLGHLCAELFSPGTHMECGYPARHTRQYLATLPGLPLSIAAEMETAR